MHDEDLLELMAVVREIPQPHWELLTFIRSMDHREFSRLGQLLNTSRPSAGYPATTGAIIKSPPYPPAEEETVQTADETVINEKDTPDDEPGLSLSDIRKFL